MQHIQRFQEPFPAPVHAVVVAQAAHIDAGSRERGHVTCTSLAVGPSVGPGKQLSMHKRCQFESSWGFEGLPPLGGSMNTGRRRSLLASADHLLAYLLAHPCSHSPPAFVPVASFTALSLPFSHPPG